MKKNVTRYSVAWKNIYVKKGKNIIPISWKILKKKYKIKTGAIIQLLKLDFELIKENTKKLTHFNLQFTKHEPGTRYLIVKIAKAGYFDGKIKKQPVLDLRSFFLSKCLSARNNLDYKNLTKEVFRNSLSNIKNVDQLKKSIVRRYKKSLVHFSDYEKLSLGVAITKLKIIKKIYLNQKDFN